MTNITYTIIDNSIEVKATGHAGYAELGKDIVCSAISVLLQTFCMYCQHHTDEFNAEIRAGHIFAKATGGNTLIAFDMLLTGLLALEEEYPQHIRVIGCSIQELTNC